MNTVMRRDARASVGFACKGGWVDSAGARAKMVGRLRARQCVRVAAVVVSRAFRTSGRFGA
eukprot:11181732-Lingulodinium_polyedra.AAC.1